MMSQHCPSNEVDSNFNLGSFSDEELKEIYKFSPFLQERFVAGKKLGYSKVRIFLNEHREVDYAICGAGLFAYAYLAFFYFNYS